MKKWYKESYFNSRNWILENFEKLGLNSEQAFFLLLIDFAKETNKNITYDFLIEKLTKKQKDIDKLIASLVEKNYLKINIGENGLDFDIDSIYEFDPKKYDIEENSDLYSLLDETFKRPLTVNELSKVNSLIETYSEDAFVDALRIAEANRKVKINYIEGILKNEKSF